MFCTFFKFTIFNTAFNNTYMTTLEVKRTDECAFYILGRTGNIYPTFPCIVTLPS